VPRKIPLTRRAGVPLGSPLALQWDDAVVSASGEKATRRVFVVLFFRKQCGNNFRTRLRAALWVRGGSPWELLVGTPLARRLDGVMDFAWVDDVV
jgi:hypothetical protein